jgi:tagaturonate reductase
MVLGAYLAGQSIVRDCMEDEVICGFMNKAIYEEIIPTLTLPKEELESFAHSVTERFKNPFIDHALLSIALNSTSKWKTRVLPSVKEYIQKKNALPKCLTASFAFYLAFYRETEFSDDKAVEDFYLAHKKSSARELAFAICKETGFWGEDLTELPGFAESVADTLEEIEQNGTYEVMKMCLE